MAQRRAMPANPRFIGPPGDVDLMPGVVTLASPSRQSLPPTHVYDCEPESDRAGCGPCAEASPSGAANEPTMTTDEQHVSGAISGRPRRPCAEGACRATTPPATPSRRRSFDLAVGAADARPPPCPEDVGRVHGAGQPVIDRFDDQFDLGHFDYTPGAPADRRAALPQALPVKVAYTDWGPADAPIIVCCGGVANTAMRFNYLAADLESHFRVVCMDWVGRGRSGWMADRARLLARDLRRAAAPADRPPGRRAGDPAGLVDGRQRRDRARRAPPEAGERLILNDIGPLHPGARRKRRSPTRSRATTSSAIPRTCCARSAPRRRTTARSATTSASTSPSTRPSGPTRRAAASTATTCARCRPTAPTRRRASTSGASGERVRCPVLLIHGMLSDALLAPHHQAHVARQRRSR